MSLFEREHLLASLDEELAAALRRPTGSCHRRGGDRQDRADPFLLATTFTALVTSQPTVLILEDVHWADGATLDLLVYLGRRLSSAPLLVVITFRSDEVTAEHPLQGALGRLAGSPQRRLPIPPLSLAAVTELASGIFYQP